MCSTHSINTIYHSHVYFIKIHQSLATTTIANRPSREFYAASLGQIKSRMSVTFGGHASKLWQLYRFSNGQCHRELHMVPECGIS
jgi:hypothetical protein